MPLAYASCPTPQLQLVCQLALGVRPIYPAGDKTAELASGLIDHPNKFSIRFVRWMLLPHAETIGAAVSR